MNFTRYTFLENDVWLFEGWHVPWIPDALLQCLYCFTLMSHGAMASQITGNPTVCSTVFGGNTKGNVADGRWISFTKEPICGKNFHVMASSWLLLDHAFPLSTDEPDPGFRLRTQDGHRRTYEAVRSRPTRGELRGRNQPRSHISRPQEAHPGTSVSSMTSQFRIPIPLNVS